MVVGLRTLRGVHPKFDRDGSDGGRRLHELEGEGGRRHPGLSRPAQHPGPHRHRHHPRHGKFPLHVTRGAKSPGTGRSSQEAGSYDDVEGGGGPFCSGGRKTPSKRHPIIPPFWSGADERVSGETEGSGVVRARARRRRHRQGHKGDLQWVLPARRIIAKRPLLPGGGDPETMGGDETRRT